MDESLEGLDWLLTQLKGDSTITTALTGGIWPLQAPEGAVPPYAVVSPMGGRDISPMGVRLLYEGVYQVRMWGYATASDTLKTAGNAADTLLQRGSGTTSGANILSCIRDNPLPPVAEWDGQQLRIGIGGLYRLQIQAN